MNNIRDIQTLLYDFYIVAKEKGYSAAAKKYSLQQSNLSRNIQNLESILKLKLIISNNKGINLTIDGERLFAKIEPAFASLSDINSDILSDNDLEQIGKITIGTTRNIADNRLVNYLSKFHKLYPKVNIDIITDSATNLNDYLINHKIDVLIDYLPHINSSQKYSIAVEGFDEFDTCFACSKDFFEQYGKKITKLSDLTKYELVIPGSSRRRQFLNEILQANNIKLNPTIQMPDSKLMADFVKDNNCIGYFIIDEIEDYDLVKLELDVELPKNRIGIMYPEYTANNITKKFVELITK